MAYFWAYFTHFLAPPPRPGNYCTVPVFLPVFLAKSCYDDKAFFIFEYLNRLRCVKPRF